MAAQATGDQHLDKGATRALLIDGDNASPKIVAGLLAEVAKCGVAGIRRIYGDWTKPNLGGWKDCLLEHSIQPIQQFAHTTGTNATDGAMIIDAMDLLYTARFDGFCIVSSDSDFARLAGAHPRARRDGLWLRRAQDASPFRHRLRQVCLFRRVECAGARSVRHACRAAEAKAKATKNARDTTLLTTLSNAIADVSDESCWTTLGPVGSHIAKQSPEFDARNYGFARLSDLVEASGIVDNERIGDPQKIVMVRLKPAQSKEGKADGRRSSRL